MIDSCMPDARVFAEIKHWVTIISFNHSKVFLFTINKNFIRWCHIIGTQALIFWGIQTK